MDGGHSPLFLSVAGELGISWRDKPAGPALDCQVPGVAMAARPACLRVPGSGYQHPNKSKPRDHMHPLIADILTIILAGQALSHEEAERLPSLLPAHRLDIYAAARLAASSADKRIFSCGIINAKSGRCAEDCAFCAQSAHHSASAPVYGLVSAEKLLERAEYLAAGGADYMGIVISGTAPTERDFEKLCEAAKMLRERIPIQLCASFGILSPGQAIALKEAGFSSCHHNLETARSWYGLICSTHAYEARVETVKNALTAGLRVCSGGIFGLGESWKERLELSQCLQKLGTHSIPVNFLTPIEGTPMENRSPLAPEEALDIVALMRLMHPEKDIIICGGRAKTLGRWENSLLFAGANALMVGDYLTTSGSAGHRDREIFSLLGER